MPELTHEKKLELSTIVDRKLSEALVEILQAAPGIDGNSIVLCLLAGSVRILHAAGAPLQLLRNESEAIFLHFESEAKKGKVKV